MRPQGAIFLAGVVLWLAGGGCALGRPDTTAAPPPIPPGGGAPLLVDEQVAQARKLFLTKCARCHDFHAPSKYSETEWERWMQKMSRKARLKQPEEQLLRDYLSLFRH